MLFIHIFYNILPLLNIQNGQMLSKYYQCSMMKDMSVYITIYLVCLICVCIYVCVFWFIDPCEDSDVLNSIHFKMYIYLTLKT